jgi:hypothetical protein
MAWTPPRTWVDGETPGASTFNTHVRDNLLDLFARVPLDPRTEYQYVNDFHSVANDGVLNMQGTGAAPVVRSPLLATGSQRPGQCNLGSGTAIGRGAGFQSSTNQLMLGGGEVVFETSVNIPTLSNATDRWQFFMGLFDTAAALTQTNGVFFLYDEGGVHTGSTAATYWQTCTSSASTRTFNNSIVQTTVTAATWTRLTLIVNAAGTSVTFYVNGSAISTHTTNIPTAGLGFGGYVHKSAGTLGRDAVFDYVKFRHTLTTAR